MIKAFQFCCKQCDLQESKRMFRDSFGVVSGDNGTCLLAFMVQCFGFYFVFEVCNKPYSLHMDICIIVFLCFSIEFTRRFSKYRGTALIHSSYKKVLKVQGNIVDLFILRFSVYWGTVLIYLSYKKAHKQRHHYRIFFLIVYAKPLTRLFVTLI